MSERALPAGWAWATVGEVAAIQLGKMLDKGKPSHGASIPYLRNVNVRWGYVTLDDLFAMYFTDAEVEKFRLVEGDLLVCEGGEPGRCAVWTSSENVLYQKAIHRVRSLGGIEPIWMQRWLLNLATAGDLQQFLTGTTIKHLPAEKLATVTLPIPPLAEQRRIVAKLDELLARSRRAREELAEVPALLARYRESVLAAAFRGDLTADWREAHPETRAAEVGENAWARVELDSLCESRRPITYGVVKLGEEVPDGVPCLRTSNVRWLRLECDGMKRIAPTLSAQYGRTVLRGGEVLVNVRGTLGGVAVVEPSMAGWNISREVAVVPSDASKIDPQFLAFTIGAARSQSILQGMEKGNAYTGINIEDLRKLPIELPPLAEQREIVRRVEAAFARVDAIEAAVAEQRARLDAYDRSLLARAFAGELVPQDPADEPAAALLARLRAERDEAPPTRGRRRRT